MNIKLKCDLTLHFKLFVCLCVLAELLSSCIFTSPYYRFYILPVLLYGGILLIWTFWVDRRIYENKLFPLLFLFVLYYGIVILIYYHSGFFTNCGHLLYTCFYFFVFFCFFSLMKPQERADLFNFLFILLIISALVFSVIGLGMFFLNYSRSILIDGKNVGVGIQYRGHATQLYGIATLPVKLGEMCIAGMMSIFLLTYFTYRTNKRCFIVGIILNIIFILTICAASSFQCLLMLMALTASFAICRRLSGIAEFHGRQLFRKILAAAFIGGLCCVLVWVLYYKIQEIEAFIINGIVTISNDISTQPIEPIEPIQPARDIETSLQSGRFKVWADYLQLFLAHPFGVTKAYRLEALRNLLGDELYTNSPHNGYLEILVSAGFIGFCLVIIFGLILFTRAIHWLICCDDQRIGNKFSGMIAYCLCVLAGDMCYNCFVLGRRVTYILFWLFLGEIYATIFNKPDVKNPKHQITLNKL